MNPAGSFDHLRRARASYEAHRYDLSVTSSLDAIAAEPNDATAHVILSLSYDRLGRTREAEAAAQRAIALDPENARAYIALGVVRLTQTRYPEALRAFTTSSELDPDDDDAFRLAAIAQMNQQYFAAALASIGRALEIAPDVIASREVRAMTLRLMGRIDEAEAETALVLRLHPESVLGLSQQGFLTLRRGDPVRARAAFREALRLDPNSPSVRAGYQAVVLSASPFASWCGRPLFFAGLFFFCSYSAALRISTELGVAAIVTALVIWSLNRPLADEALRSDEIGRTLVQGTAQQNRRIIAYALAAEATLFIAVPSHQPPVFWATFGFLMAAVAAGHTAHARLRARTRAIYAAAALAFAIVCSAGSVFACLCGGFEVPASADNVWSNAMMVTLFASVIGAAAFAVFDGIVMLPDYAEAIARRVAAASARFGRH